MHLLTAVAALLLGVGDMYAAKQKGWHTRLGNSYHWLVVVAVTAILLAATDWQRLWWFLSIAVFSERQSGATTKI